MKHIDMDLFFERYLIEIVCYEASSPHMNVQNCLVIRHGLYLSDRYSQVAPFTGTCT